MGTREERKMNGGARNGEDIRGNAHKNALGSLVNVLIGLMLRHLMFY